MDKERLSFLFIEADKTDDFHRQEEVLEDLLYYNTRESLLLQYEFFISSTSTIFKMLLGKGFLKRSSLGNQFLVEMLEIEKETTNKANLIHLIGLTYKSEYITTISQYLTHKEFEIRYKSIVALGWIGEESTTQLLIKHFYVEKDTLLKCFCITALRQIFFRLNVIKTDLCRFLFLLLTEETDQEILAVVIVTIQDLTKKKFGLKEDNETGGIKGNIDQAKNNILKNFEFML